MNLNFVFYFYELIEVDRTLWVFRVKKGFRCNKKGFCDEAEEKFLCILKFWRMPSKTICDTFSGKTKKEIVMRLK